ncbi:COG4705 family protein [Streptomyces aureus]|uniref:Integral membrane protein n=1 Tax=Streptomyces aureus TaxID=193461 RepID=A0ABV4SYN5_9ACTN
MPVVGALFWAIKIVATTLGESVSNYVAITPLKLGYAAAVIIFLAAFALTLMMQLRADRFRPAVFWSVILMTSIVGTAMSDFMNRTVGLGYTGGAAVLTTLLVLVLIGWRATGQTMDVERIATTKAEILYWTATLLSNTLGTSSGDFMSHTLGLGFRGSALLLSAVMLLILAAHYLTPISGTVLFWTAYVLTRPLGAVVENTFEKPTAQGGMGVGTTITSATLLAALVVLVGYQMLTHRPQTLTLDAPPDAAAAPDFTQRRAQPPAPAVPQSPPAGRPRTPPPALAVPSADQEPITPARPPVPPKPSRPPREASPLLPPRRRRRAQLADWLRRRKKRQD